MSSRFLTWNRASSIAAACKVLSINEFCASYHNVNSSKVLVATSLSIFRQEHGIAAWDD
ncbi:hypothetical protein ACLOJK_006738, partial [Asimina triloba]